MKYIQANIYKRALAVIIDHLIINIALIFIYFQFIAQDPDRINLSIEAYYLFTTINFLYFFLAESVFHQTIGKKIFNIRVISVTDKPVRWTQILIRNLLRPIDFIGFYLLGFIFISLSSKSQRIGDLLAKTMVVENV